MIGPEAILAGLKLFVAVAFGWEKRRREVSRDDRDRVAKYCIDIADCLDRCKADFDRGEVPHGACAEMQGYLVALLNVVGKEMSDDRKQEMQRLLNVAYRVEQLGFELERERNGMQFAELAVIAGRFREAGNTLQATKVGS